MLTPATPKQPTHIAFQFDGTEASIDALNERLTEGNGPALAGYISPTAWRLTNNTDTWSLEVVGDRGLDEVVVFARGLGDGIFQIAHTYEDATMFNSLWESL